MNRCLEFVRRVSASPIVFSCLSGGIAGACLISALAPFRVALGSGGAVDAGILIAAACSFWLLRSFRVGRPLAAQLGPWNLVVAAGWAVAVPVLLQGLLRGLHLVPLVSLESLIVQTSLATGMALVALGPVFLGLGGAFRAACRRDVQRERAWLSACALSCAVTATGLLPFTGAWFLAVAALVAGGLLVARERWNPNRSNDEVLFLPPSTALGSAWNPLLLSFLTGCSLAVVLSMTSQLIPRGLLTDTALLAGVVLSYGLANHKGKNGLSSMTVWLGLSAWIAVLAAGYPVWTWFCLQMNARVSSLVMLISLRVLFLMTLTLPAGLLLRRGTPLTAHDQVFQPILVVAGFLAVSTLSWTTSSTACLLSSISLGAAVLTGTLLWRKNRQFPPAGHWKKFAVGGLGAAAVLGLSASGNLDPRNSEKILFSGPLLQQARQGVRMEKLRWLDDGRLVAAFETPSDRVSLWSCRGSQWILRQNGLPTGLYSTTADQSPHSAADILPMLLPLAFHPGAEDVLVLGIHPAALFTCQNYPLRLVRTLDGNTGSHRLLDWLAQHLPTWNLTGGAEFQFGRVDPLIAMHSDHECLYDLIVCPLTHPATTMGISQTSLEFYQAVAGQLKEGGIFTQRIPYYDLGPDAVRTIASTLRSAFADVTAIETIPGELVFLCSTSRLPEVNESLVNRLKAPQCRRLLGDSGWDWSMVLGRGGLTLPSLNDFVGTHARLNRCGDARWGTGLSLEVSRWGIKADATREVLARHGDALRSALLEDSLAQEVSHRLEDLNLAHQLQQNHPNDPWGYRKAIKDRLQDRPRTELVHVSYEGLKRVLDSEDRRRKEYLSALGEVARQPHPSPEKIEQLTGFEIPFDPLVSLFVHHESIQLMDRSSAPDRNIQYRYLLKTVYFANAQDQSVRNASRALQLACDEQAVPLSTTERWDHVNGLLQTLSYRWQMRWQSGRVSKFDAVDTEQSVQAVEQGLKLLARTASDCGLTSDEWELRHECLEESLVRPLRQKRSQHLRAVPVTPVLSSSDDSTESAAPSAEEPAP